MIKNLKSCNRLKLFFLSALAAGVLTSTPSQAQSVLAAPPCDTTTCITGEMIGIAKNALVKRDLVIVNFELLDFAACTPPRLTGVTVQKQIPGEILTFPDSFCTNQGCSPALVQGASAPPQECN